MLAESGTFGDDAECIFVIEVCLFVCLCGRQGEADKAATPHKVGIPHLGFGLTSKNNFNVLLPSDVVEGI